jgi:glycogen operon protein
MLAHGDELGRTQHGNNNAYCQDNELSWMDWASADDDLNAFVATASRLRRAHPTFRRRRFFRASPVRDVGDPVPDISWLTSAGIEMTHGDWDSSYHRAFAVFFRGDGINERDDRGAPITDVSFLLCFNAHDSALDFRMPPVEYADAWDVVLDTALSRQPSSPEIVVGAGGSVPVIGRSLVVLRATD